MDDRERLTTARKFIKAHDYETARAILLQMPNNTVAIKWLANLEQLIGQKDSVEKPEPIRRQEADETRVCPYLRSFRDKKLVYEYSTSQNGCYAGTEVAGISYEHQEVYCLNERYRQCPVYKQPLLTDDDFIIDFVQEVPGPRTVTTHIEKSFAEQQSEKTVSRTRPGCYLEAIIIAVGIAGGLIIWFLLT